MEQELISIVIPLFNRAHTIEKCVESIRLQTYKRWEAVFVDDDSTDDSWPTLEAFSKKDHRIRIFRHERNKGAQAARNTGIRNAMGRWISFLDADDVYLPDSLMLRWRCAKEGGWKVVHSACLSLKGSKGSPEGFPVPSLRGYIHEELLRSHGPVFPAMLVMKRSLERIGYLDESLCAYQEWDTAIRLSALEPFGFVEEPTFIYDCRSTERISADMKRDAIGYEQVVRKHRGSILRHIGCKPLGDHYLTAAEKYKMADMKIDALRCMALASLFLALSMEYYQTKWHALKHRFGG